MGGGWRRPGERGRFVDGADSLCLGPQPSAFGSAPEVTSLHPYPPAPTGPRAGDYTYREGLEHKCKRDLLLGRLRSSEDQTWKRIRPRPTKTSFVGSYYLCKGGWPATGGFARQAGALLLTGAGGQSRCGPSRMNPTPRERLPPGPALQMGGDIREFRSSSWPRSRVRGLHSWWRASLLLRQGPQLWEGAERIVYSIEDWHIVRLNKC